MASLYVLWDLDYQGVAAIQIGQVIDGRGVVRTTQIGMPLQIFVSVVDCHGLGTLTLPCHQAPLRTQKETKTCLHCGLRHCIDSSRTFPVENPA